MAIFTGTSADETISPLEVSASVTATGGDRPSDADDTITGGGGNDTLRGGGGSDIITGGDTGIDSIDGGDGDDLIHAGDGADSVMGGIGVDTIFLEGGLDNLTWRTGDGDDNADGGDGFDSFHLFGSAAEQEIELADTATGVQVRDSLGAAVDLAAFESLAFHAAGGGAQTFRIGRIQNVQQVIVDLAADAFGNEGDNISAEIHVALTDGNDNVTITRPADFSPDLGTVTVSGLEHSLSIARAEADDRVILNGGIGNDRLGAAEVDPVVGTVSALDLALTLDGGIGDDVLTGGSLRDILIGGEGNDVVAGGGGGDGVLLAGGTDLFLWKAGDGNDDIGGGLGRDQFDMRGSGAADAIRLDAAGLGLIDAAAGAETVALTAFERVRLTGLGGADRLEIGPMAGTGLTELIIDLAGAPGAASGDGAADEIVLRGSDADDALAIALRPGDFAVAGLGYTLAVRAMEAGDRLSFLGGAGADRFDGAALAALMTLDGGAGDDVLAGGALGDLIHGRGDKDALSGGLGDDRLFGGEGGDLLNGGAGDDRTNGGVGDDIHFVNSARDIVTEAAGQGADRVVASASYILPLAAEIEQLATNAAGGTAAIDLTGNDFVNIVTGNAGTNMLNGRGADDSLSGGAGDDRLNGGLGGDRMRGGAGDDQYFADQSGEAVEAAGEGTDTVFSTESYRLGNNIERLVLRGSAGEETKAGAGQGLEGIGNSGDNAIFGDAFANRIDGQGGNDRLIGGAGADRFAFSTRLNAATNVDRIIDFAPGSDTIALFSSLFGDLPTGPLAESAFATGAAAADETDRIIYDPATGSLFFDADGLGGAAQIRFAILQPGLAVSAADIEVFFAT